MSPMKYRLLQILSIVLAALGLMTVLPFNGASTISAMGYKSICPFSPFSTVIIGYVSLTIHRYLNHTQRI